MPILYEELEGSPTITMNREGGAAQRVVKVAWTDIGRAILEIFPGALFGYPYTASLPGFKWLRAQSMDIAPWNPEHPTGTGQVMNTYPAGAKITVNYAPNKYPDADYKDGPDGGDLADVTFLEQKVTFGGEYLTWPNGGVRWQKNADGTIAQVNGGGGKAFQVFEDINVGVVIPTIEHNLTWNYILIPPWAGIRNCIGKVNSVNFLGAAPETLLFAGCSASRTYSTQGSPTWKLEYRISEKCYNAPLVAGRGLSGPIVTAGGSGYAIGDKLGFLGGIGGPTADVVVTAANPGTGAVTAVAVTVAGYYTTLPPRPNTVRSLTGSGSGATITDGFNTVSTPEPQGWNHFLRPETGRFERMVRKYGEGIYRSANFRQLFGGRP